MSKEKDSILNPRTTTYEFLGPPGAFLISTGGCPPTLIPERISLALSDPAWWKGLWDTQAALLYLAWYAFCLVAWVVLPGDLVAGTTLRTGGKKLYKINGTISVILFIIYVPSCIGFYRRHYLSLWPGVIHFFYEKFVGFITASLIMSVVQGVACYAASFRPGALLALGGNSGNPIYDFYVGRELNPFSMVCEQATRRGGFGQVTDSLYLITLFQGLYVADSLYNESGIFTTMDVTTDGFGFMLSVGDLAWVPFTFCLQARYLVFNPVELGPVLTAVVVVFNFSGYYIFRVANAEKNDFRNGTNPKNLQFMTTESGSKLLTSGWWGRSRHPNYFGDLLMSVAWSLPTGFSTPIPYFYCLYFLVLLIHRQRRDDEACEKKYGKDWKKYMQLVPYRIIPYVY
ncbi:ERG4 ERG24 ergosterol biosynthesis protein, partial [Mycena olivaceomarginata]